jgi:Subtilase family
MGETRLGVFGRLGVVGWSRSCACVVALALAVAGCDGGEGHYGPAVRPDAARALPAAAQQGAWQCAARELRALPSELELMRLAVQTFPETGVLLYRYVFLSRASGKIALCDVDVRGAAADEHALAEAERVARVEHHGRMDRGLEHIADEMKPGERRWILVQIPVAEPAAGAGSNLLRSPRAAAAERERVNAAVAAGLPRVLALLPANVAWSPPRDGAPFFRARVDALELRTLARSNDVGWLYDGEPTPQVPLGADSCRVNQVFLTKTDQAHALGLVGNNIKVGTLEEVCIDPNLPLNPMDPMHAQVVQNCNTPNQHGGTVMGYISNTNPDDPEQNPPDPMKFGFAPHAELFSANAFAMEDRFAFLAAHGVALANMSFYSPPNLNVCPMPQSLGNALSDYYATHAPFILSVWAGGNEPYLNGCVADKVLNIVLNGIVVGPAYGHQVFQCPQNQPCGYYYEQHSVDRTLDWTRGAPMGDFFCWANPDANWGWLEVGDLELPHMNTYADGMKWSLSNFCEAGGTSFAAPQVTGAAALLSQANGALYGRPEALKAILMAGADVNTDLNTPGLGAAYSYYPLYNNLGFGGGTDRHGGAGLLNTLASAQIAAPNARLKQNNRFGIDFNIACQNTSNNIVAYQHTQDNAIQNEQRAPGLNGHDYGVMDPAADFDGIWYKNFYYFAPQQQGNLRIVLAWNRPYTCTFGQNTSCGPDWKPDLNMLLRDLDSASGAVQTAATWDPNEEVIAAPVQPGHVYRLDIYQQNYWPGPESFGLGAFFTTNAQ